jgi:hypothetical protein
MRAHPGIAVATMILAGFGVKLAFFTDPTVAAGMGSAQRAAIDISGMHRHIKNLPVENFHDMTFVFSKSNGG